VAQSGTFRKEAECGGLETAWQCEPTAGSNPFPVQKHQDQSLVVKVRATAFFRSILPKALNYIMPIRLSRK